VGYTYGITDPIAIPDEECEFRTFVGIKDGGDVSDGVVFSVLVLDAHGTQHTLLEQHWAKREWKELSADLSKFRGQTVRLKLVTDVGPSDNSVADWASWGEPRAIAKRPRLRVKLGDKE